MKKTLIIILAVVGTIIVVFFAIWKVYGWAYRNANNPEPFNKNLTFIGNDNRTYMFSKTVQNPDSSIVIASVLIKMTSLHKEIDVMKLSSTGQLLWEKEFPFERFSMWDMVPGLIRRGRDAQQLEIQGINLVEGKYYLLLYRYNDAVYAPYILTLDADGKMLGYKKVPLAITMSSPHSYMQDNYAYMSYLDNAVKKLFLVKVDIRNGTILDKASLPYSQDSLYINTIIADKADSTVSLTAYDSQQGCSLYQYTKAGNLKEVFRTKPDTDYTVLTYLNNKLYGVANTDSLVMITDLSDALAPKVILSDKPGYPKVRGRGLLQRGKDLYLVIDVDNPQAKVYRHDVLIRKYTSDKIKPSDYLIQGKRNEYTYKIYPLKDGKQIVIGSSLSMSLNKGFRVFATKIAM
jgi:hypothetical protein